MLLEKNYLLFVECLFRNVENGEVIDVFSNDFLKYLLVIEVFIDIMVRKLYCYLYFVFFLELKGNVNC